MENQKKEDALISVIVPIYNVEKWLRDCVKSILNQTYKNLEIILIDDGSTDRCGQICDQFLEKDSRIKVFHKANGGLSDARNYGLSQASGKYICFVDSDDYIEENMIEKLYLAIRKSDAEVAVCNFLYQYEVLGKTPDPYSYQIEKEKVLAGKEFILLKNQKCVFCVVAWNKLYRRDVFYEIQFPVGKVHEDEFIFHKLFYPCKRVICIPYIGYHYRIRKNSIMGRGGNSIHRVEALISRCMYFYENKDDEMLLLGEMEMLREIKRGGDRGSLHEIKDLMNKSYCISKLLYQKNMISFWELIQRGILYYGFYPMATEARKSVWKIRSRSRKFNYLWCWIRCMLKGA